MAWAMLLELSKIGRQQASKSKKAVLNEERSVLSGFMEQYGDYDSLKKRLLETRGTIVKLKGRGRSSASFLVKWNLSGKFL